MTEHLADDVLARLALTGPDERHGGSRHLADCPNCHTRLTVWQDIGSALRLEEAELAVTPPSFDALLGPALAAAEAGVSRPGKGLPVAPPAGSPAAARPGQSCGPGRVAFRFRGPDRSLRTAWQLVLRQASLMPRAWAPLSAGSFVGATLLAAVHAQDRFALRVFGAVVVLLVMFGVLMVASPRRDPRRELLFTLPVSPTAVFLARLTVVLCADVAMAMVCSAVVDGPGWWPVVSSWLGESLLAASLALALAVRFAPAAGATAGGALWLLGVVSGPHGVFATPLDALLGPLLSTTPWALALAAVLLCWAVGATRSVGPAEPST